MDVGDRPCAASAMINFSMIQICDELKYLGYNESEKSTESFVAVPILFKKKEEEVSPDDIFKMFFGRGGG